MVIARRSGGPTKQSQERDGFAALAMTFFLLYQAGLLAFGAAYLALRLLRGQRLPGLRERLARYSPELERRLAGLRAPIWLHAVSVGEVLAAVPLVEELRARFPGRGWVVSTVTPAGREVAERNLKDGRTELVYLPWDLTSIVRRAIRRIRPSLFLCLETELWPALFRELGRAGVPVAVVNGRISPATYGRYLLARPFMERSLSPVALFLAQSPQDARRLAAIGAAKDRLVVTGNLKWDLPAQQPSDELSPKRLRALLGLAEGDLLWAAGSTHPGEERLLLQVYIALKSEVPRLKLLLAPRHPERAAAVGQEIRAAGLSPVLRSEMGRTAPNGQGVVVLDTLGELAAFYGAADVVFVGGSLVPHGGHNLVEPAALARPILAGPHLHNFQSVSDALRQASGMIVTRSAEELRQALRRLFRDPLQAQALGRRARAVFEENQGAVRRTADLIELRWSRELTLVS